MEFAALKSGERVLETACGTGLVKFRAAEIVGPSGSVLATDISGEMIAATAARALELGLDHVRSKRMEAERLGIEVNSFDVAVCALGLMYVPDPVEALSEMRRALRHGGRVVSSVWGERRNCGWAEVFPIVDACVVSEVCPLFFALGAPGALAGAMERAGFVGVRARRERALLRFDDDADALNSVIDGGAVALAAKRFASKTRRRVDEEFLFSIEGFRSVNGGYAIPGEFVTASARRPNSA
jgi:SAM-dependent methyltransferase